MGRTFQADEEASVAGFHREQNAQLLSEFWLVLASRASPELLSSTERPVTLDTVFENLHGVGWDMFWEHFPLELREQCACLDEDSVDALTILCSSSRNKERFQRHFCDTDDEAAAPAAAAAAAAAMPAPRVGSVRSRGAAGLGLGASARAASASSRQGSRRFEAVHDALTADDEDLVGIVLDLIGPCHSTRLPPKAVTDRRLVRVAARVPLAPSLVQSVGDELGSARRGKDVRLFSLVVGSGRSRSALAAAAALHVTNRQVLYVDLRGVFGEDDLDHALLTAVFTHNGAADSTAGGGDTASEYLGGNAVVVDRTRCADEAGTMPGAAGDTAAAAIPEAAAHTHTRGRSEGIMTSRGVDVEEDRVQGAQASVLGADKAAAEQDGDDRCTAGTDQQQLSQQQRQQQQQQQGAGTAGPGVGSVNSGILVGLDTRGGYAESSQATDFNFSNENAANEHGPGPASVSGSEAADAWMQEGRGSAPELVYGHLKLLGCTCKAPLLLLLDEVDAAMAHEEGRALREMLHKLLVLLPGARILLTSSALCELSDCTLLRLWGGEPVVLPDSRGMLRSYQVRQHPVLY